MTMDAWNMTSPWGEHRDIYLTGNLRALEAKGISREILNRLMNARSVADGLDCLKGTVYGSCESHDTEDILEYRRKTLYLHIAAHTDQEDLVRLMALPYDYHNLKTGLKNILHQTGHWDLMVPWGSISPREIREVFESESYDRLPGSMEKALILAIERYFSLKKPVVTDLVLDRAMHGHALDLCRSLNSGILTGHWRQRIDMANIRAFARKDLYPDLMDDLFIPEGNLTMDLFSGSADRVSEALRGYTEYESLACAMFQTGKNPLALEREVDQVLSENLSLCRFLTWGVEAVYAHIYAVELEIRIVGLVFAALSSGMDRELLNLRLPSLFGET